MGFSLVELLVVVTIIVVLLALTVPAFSLIGKAGTIESSADMVVGMLGLARQTAISKNKVIEARFYDIPADGMPTNYRAMQLFEISDSGSAVPSTKVMKIQVPIIFSRDPGLSTLFDSSLYPDRVKVWSVNDPQVALPGVGSNYNCRVIRFRPNGTTDLLVSGKWHVTIVDANRPGSAARPPANFATVWVEPANGSTKVFRP